MGVVGVGRRLQTDRLDFLLRDLSHGFILLSSKLDACSTTTRFTKRIRISISYPTPRTRSFCDPMLTSERPCANLSLDDSQYPTPSHAVEGVFLFLYHQSVDANYDYRVNRLSSCTARIKVRRANSLDYM